MPPKVIPTIVHNPTKSSAKMPPKCAKMRQHGRKLAKVGPREAKDEEQMPRRRPKWTKMFPRAKTEPSKTTEQVRLQELGPSFRQASETSGVRLGYELWVFTSFIPKNH